MPIGSTPITPRSAPERSAGTTLPDLGPMTIGVSAVVVGGSLAGLTAALALAVRGIETTVLERSGPEPRDGGALAATFSELVDVIGEEHARTTFAALPPGAARGEDPVMWMELREGLRSAAEAEPLISLRHSCAVVAVSQELDHAEVTTADGEVLRASVVIGADGHRSLVRRALVPQHPDATYAGYSLWIGRADEHLLRGAATARAGLDIRSSGPHYLLGYPMPSRDGARGAGRRRLGWAWYDATRNGLMRELGAVSGRVVQHSVRSADIPARTWAELEDEARAHWPSPWRDAIVDSIRRREVTGIPIAEYVPERLASGRLAVVGNAAHVPTPMTGSGYAASLDDAASLASALRSARDDDVPERLAEYERDRLLSARGLVTSGQGFSRSFAIED